MSAHAAPRREGYWLYVLGCGDGTLYAGIARDVEARLAQHAAGRGARYTRGRGPLVVVARVYCGEKGLSLSLERAFKRLRREEKGRLVGDELALRAWARGRARARGERLPRQRG